MAPATVKRLARKRSNDQKAMPWKTSDQAKKQSSSRTGHSKKEQFSKKNDQRTEQTSPQLLQAARNTLHSGHSFYLPNRSSKETQKCNSPGLKRLQVHGGGMERDWWVSNHCFSEAPVIENADWMGPTHFLTLIGSFHGRNIGNLIFQSLKL